MSACIYEGSEDIATEKKLQSHAVFNVDCYATALIVKAAQQTTVGAYL